MNRHAQRGATTLEWVFVGIPIMFVLISVIEISRGMWYYHTLAYAVKEGVRYASVHGVDCNGFNQSGAINNNCTTTVQGQTFNSGTIAAVAQVIQSAGIGLDLDNTQLTFISGGNPEQLSNGLTSDSLSDCLTNGTQWPAPGDVGTPIEIDITTPFNSALAMFWPGSQPVNFASVLFWASSSGQIEF